MREGEGRRERAKETNIEMAHQDQSATALVLVWCGRCGGENKKNDNGHICVNQSAGHDNPWISAF